ncbi:hypothetical protein MBLNU230_g2920t2 [Neophaeotheca triangularis]
MRPPVQRRRRTTKASRTAQLEQLENKLETLVNALSATQGRKQFSDANGQLSPPVSVTASDQNSIQSREVIQRRDHESVPASNSASTASYSGLASPSCHVEAAPFDRHLDASFDEAEMLLDRYRRYMAPGCPFVLIGSEETAFDMRQKRPFLLHAIVVFAYYHDWAKQADMLLSFMRDVSERVLINSEKTIDIIQGLVVAIAFFHSHAFSKMQLANLTGLATSLVSALGLNREPGSCLKHEQAQCDLRTEAGTDKSALESSRATTDNIAARKQTLNEHRAVAGVFYQSSTFSVTFERTAEPLKYTKFLESALQTLEEAHEYESDLLLVQLVRIQHLAERVESMEATHAPMHLHIQLLKQELAALRPSIPYKSPQEHQLQLQVLSAEILIHELALSPDPPGPALANHHTHLEALHASSNAITAFNTAFFALPTHRTLTYPFSIFAQFAHSFITMTKLASLDLDFLGPRAAETLAISTNFLTSVEQAVAKFEAAGNTAPDAEIVRNDSFAKWAHRIRWMRSIYEAKFPSSSKQLDAPSEQQVLNNNNTNPAVAPAMQQSQHHPQALQHASLETAGTAAFPSNFTGAIDDGLNADFFSYLDEGFWQSFSGDFEMGFANPTTAAVSEGMQMT